MELARKLQIMPGSSVALLGRPAGVDLHMPAGIVAVADAAAADAVVAFVRVAGDLDTAAAPALVAARDDRIAWIAYPKAGQLSTDLNRDRLAAQARERGVKPVRQISVDDVWSALRFRPV